MLMITTLELSRSGHDYRPIPYPMLAWVHEPRRPRKSIYSETLLGYF